MIPGDAGSVPGSSTRRSKPTLLTCSGSVSSKYWKGVTKKASSPGTRRLTWPPTWLSRPSRCRIRRAAAIWNRGSLSLVTVLLARSLSVTLIGPPVGAATSDPGGTAVQAG